MANDAFRQAVTSVSFNLTLSKTQVAAIVLIEESRRRGVYIKGPHSTTWNLFVPAVSALIHRGMVTHHPPKGVHRAFQPTSTWYKFTKVGRLVVQMLEEAGLYEEYAKELIADMEVANG